MFDVAISQLSAPRLDLAEELAHATAAGIDAISLWRPKVADAGLGSVAAQLACARVRVSGLQWAGGFTAGDGRSFDESLEDAVDAIEAARLLAAPVLVVHTGCRGGHTRAHAARLVRDALETLAPVAHEAGVTLALRPIHAAVAPGGSLLTGLTAACDFVDGIDHPAVGLALDLWQFGDAPDLVPMLPRLAARAASVQVADRVGQPSPHADRLPAGHGALPLQQLLAGLCRFGYGGDFEFDPVGEAVESLGHAAVVRETASTATAWLGDRVTSAETADWLAAPRILQRRSAAAGAGSLRSHASSHTVSRG